jgi:hypothetical protein
VTQSDQPQRSGSSRGARAGVAITAILFLLIGLFFLYLASQNGDLLTLIVGFLMFAFFSSLIGSAVRPPQVSPLSRTVSVIKCYKCQYTEVRDFQKGDYMYKTVGKCKDCQGDMYIRSIYAVPIQKT